jgi:hypothetical protein
VAAGLRGSSASSAVYDLIGCGSFGVRSQVRSRVCEGRCSQIIAKSQGAGFRLSPLEAAGQEVADAPQG